MKWKIVEIILNTITGIMTGKALNTIIAEAEKFVKNAINNDFDETIKSEDFKKFKEEVLENYYGKDSFTEINGNSFPAFCFPNTKIKGYGKGIRKYDCLSNPNELNAEFDKRKHQDYHGRYYFPYSQIVKEKVVAGDRPGFMLDSLNCDKEGNVESFQAHVGTYAENVYTSHVLEYELYMAYKFKGKDFDWNRTRKFMKTRNEIHRSVMSYKGLNTPERVKEFLTSGKGRHSLLGVQMLVLMKTEEGRYKLLLIKRSQNVAIAPGYYQFVPSGGFEVFSDCPQGYSEEGIRDNLSVGCAVFREYVEEIFGEKEFQGEGEGHISDILTRDPHIQKIEQMLESGDASFEFLGSVVDLTVLRHELSFVLVIKNPDYLENNFRGNTEAANYKFIDNVYFDDFETRKDIWNNLHWSSAAMWKLFSQTDLYQELKDGKTNSKQGA